VAFRRHQREVYRYLRRRTRTVDRAEELTQDVFLDAATTLAHFDRDAEEVLPLLYAIARRRLADDARRAARRREVPLETLYDERSEAYEYGPEVARAIARATSRLSPAQRELLALRLLTGVRFADIARREGVSEGATKMRFRRALVRLREELEKEGVGP